MKIKLGKIVIVLLWLTDLWIVERRGGGSFRALRRLLAVT